MKKPLITPAQQEALKLVPAGWFYSKQLPPHLRCAHAMCLRLVKLGWLESRTAVPEGADFMTWVTTTPVRELHLFRRSARSL